MKHLLLILFTAAVACAQSVGGGIGQAVSPVVFSTGATGVSSSSVANAVIAGPTTMFTPVSDGYYRFSFYMVQTSLGTGCTVGGQVATDLGYTEASTSTATSLSGMAVQPNSGGAPTTVLTLSTSSLAASSVRTHGLPTMIYAKAGVAITYSVHMNGTPTTTCSVQSQLSFYPLLELVL